MKFKKKWIIYSILIVGVVFIFYIFNTTSNPTKNKKTNKSDEKTKYETEWIVVWYTITGEGKIGEEIGRSTFPSTFVYDWEGEKFIKDTKTLYIL